MKCSFTFRIIVLFFPFVLAAGTAFAGGQLKLNLPKFNLSLRKLKKSLSPLTGKPYISNMPVFKPRPDIDFKILRAQVDPTIDYKILTVGPELKKIFPAQKFKNYHTSPKHIQKPHFKMKKLEYPPLLAQPHLFRFQPNR